MSYNPPSAEVYITEITRTLDNKRNHALQQDIITSGNSVMIGSDLKPPYANPADGTDAIAALEQIITTDFTPVKHETVSSRSYLPLPSAQSKEFSLSERPFDLRNAPNRTIRELEAAPESKTLFYLAYGSNMCAKTFQGVRGIRPISQTNVVVPDLILTFDLPGLPYVEPCFANSKFRAEPTTGSNDDEKASLLDNAISEVDYYKNRWKKGLVGVVYEITFAEYARIMATEGGGASYQDIVIDCYTLAEHSDIVPAQPTSKPFKSHTLCILRDGRRIRRKDPSYAQASARYLKLITDGALEHSLPLEYRDYLHQIRSYTVTTTRQRIGRAISIGLWLPVIRTVFGLNSLLMDKKGRSPPWYRAFIRGVFNSVWITYDYVFKPLFGDGERTIGIDDIEDEKSNGQILKLQMSNPSSPPMRHRLQKS